VHAPYAGAMTSPYRANPLDLRIPPPVVAGAAAAAQWFLTRNNPRHTPVGRAAAAGLAAVGATIGARGLLHFDDAGTTFHPHHPEETTTLVTHGVYSRTRNPMYVGMALGLLGLAAHHGRAVALLPIPAYLAYLQRFQIRPEERALAARFGAEYAEYSRRVRRWV